MSELNSQPGSMSARALMLTLAVSVLASAFIVVVAILVTLAQLVNECFQIY